MESATPDANANRSAARSDNPAGRRPYWRLHASTCAALLLGCGFFVLLIVPGEYTERFPTADMLGLDSFTFEHGWPWIYLTREVEIEPSVIRQFELAIRTSQSVHGILPGQGIPWLQRWGWTFRGNVSESPSWIDRQPETWQPAMLILDILIAIVLLILLAATLEWRHRRRRHWQFSLSEFVGAMLVVGIALGWWSIQLHYSHQERELAEKNSRIIEFDYRGPLWLRRLVGIDYLDRFRRVVTIDLNDDRGINLRQALENVSQFKELQTLFVRSKSATENQLHPIEKLTQLRELILDIPSATDGDLANIGALTRLQELHILSCDQATSMGLRNLASLKNLEHLGLHGARVDSDGVRFLSQLRRLEQLNLSDTNVDDLGLSYLVHLTNLQHLSLANTKVQGSGLVQLNALTRLRSLTLSGTGVGDDDLQHFAGLKTLDSLVIRDTQLSDLGVAAIERSLPECKVIK
jgi:hypothetical protein